MHNVDAYAEVPFYSQMVNKESEGFDGFKSLENANHSDIRGCGIACIRMIIKAYKAELKLPSYGKMVQEGVELKAYCSKGWIHAGLVNIANVLRDLQTE